MNIDIDLLSDEVSALSMDGASAIAMNIHFARRLTRDSANSHHKAQHHQQQQQLRIPEDEEHPVASTVIVVEEDHLSSHNLDPEEEGQTNNGEKLIEEFPAASEVWQKRREKRHKAKSKRLEERSSATGGSCGSTKHRDDAENPHRERNHHRGRKSNRHGKTRSKCDSFGEPSEDREIIGESSRTLPTTEMTHFYSSKSDPATPPRCYARDHRRASDFLSYPSIVSTVDSDNSRSAGTGILSSPREQRCLSLSQSHRYPDVSRTGSTRSFHSSAHEPPQSEIIQPTTNGLSMSDRESMTITTERSAHTSGSHSHANQSHVTVEDMHTLHTKLRRAKEEEEQVSRIHGQLVDEVRLAKAHKEGAEYCQQQVLLLLEAASLEHEQLQQYLRDLNEENKKLGVILSKLEEREDERSFAEMLDSMNAKMKSYKVVKSRHSKELQD